MPTLETSRCLHQSEGGLAQEHMTVDVVQAELLASMPAATITCLAQLPPLVPLALDPAPTPVHTMQAEELVSKLRTVPWLTPPPLALAPAHMTEDAVPTGVLALMPTVTLPWLDPLPFV